MPSVNIEINITEDGIKVEPTGHKGAECLKELDELLASLDKAGINSSISDQKLKSEYYVKTEGIRHTLKR